MILRAPCVLLFVLTVCCWLRENAAIPLASDLPVANQMLHVFEEGRINSQDNSHHAASRLRTRRNVETSSLHDSFTDEFTSSEDEESVQNKVKIKNENVNVNIRNRHSGLKQLRKTIASTTTMPDLRNIKVKEDRSCVSGKKKNQRYSSSFVGNTTSRQFTIDNEFDEVIGNNSKAKTTSSMYVGEDITLCWIETTTIKEDKKVQPPKRLVIREYTISFENSATIPDRYLYCERLEGEVTANDPEIGKTALFEVIDEDTKASRVVNFTTIDNVGEVVVWQHKKVKCGVGPVVNKNIMEWNDGSKNPKKRLEIKISPEVRQLKVEKDQEPCTEEVEETSTESNIMSDSTESCESTAESSSCEVTTRSDESPTKHPDSKETEEVTVTNSSPSDEVYSYDGSGEIGSGENDSKEALILSTDHETSTLSYETTISSTTKASISQKTDKPALQGKECKENSSDPECATRGSGAFTEDKLSVKSSTVEGKSSEGPSAEFSSGSSEGDVTWTVPAWVTEQTTPAVSKTSVPTLTEFPYDIDKPRPFDQTKESGASTSTETIEGTFEQDNDRSLPSMEVNTMTSGGTSLENMITSTLSSLGLNKSMEMLKHGNVSKSPELSSSSESATEKSSLEESKETVTIRTIDRAITVEPEVVSKIGLVPLISTTSSPKYPPIVLSPAPSDEADYTCENSEDCATASSSTTCDEAGNCHATSRPCESGECLDEKIDYSELEVTPPADTWTTEVANTTALTSQETENGSTAINSVFTTSEGRRSTLLSSTIEPRHKFTLKVKILLEHVNDKKEKQNLVEVEKKMLLSENPEHSHQLEDELVQQLKSLNDSVNTETMNALLNSTSLGKLTEKLIFTEMPSGDIFDDSNEESKPPTGSTAETSSSYEYPQYESTKHAESNDDAESGHERRRQRRSLNGNLTMAVKTNRLNISEQIRPDLNDSLTSDSNRSVSTSRYEQQDEQFETSHPTEKNVQIFTTMRGSEKETTDPVYVENKRNVTRERNEKEVLKKMKTKIIQQTLPGIKEDVSIGLQHIISELTHNLTLVKDIRELAKMNLIGILMNPDNGKIHLRRRREATEEVGHWSNERIKKTSNLGGDLRSFTEFTLYKIWS